MSEHAGNEKQEDQKGGQMREKIWGEIGKINKNLKGSMETHYSRSFLKYIHI